MPCKHFFAVFRAKPEWYWKALPQSYTDGPYLQSDAKAVQEYFSMEAKESIFVHDCKENEIFQRTDTDESVLDISGDKVANFCDIYTHIYIYIYIYIL